MLDFRHLRHFCAIVAEGQISRAAHRLHISQPTLSLSLKELEDCLGFTLIQRSGGNWRITEHGELFYHEAQRILSQLDDLGARMRSPFVGKSTVYGEVRLGSSGFCLSFVRDILPGILRDYPGIHIRMLVSDNLSLESYICRQELDLALIQLPLLSDCQSLPLPPQRFVACWSPLLPPPGEGSVTLEQIAAHPVLLARRWSNNGAYRPFMIAMQERGIEPAILVDTPFASILRDYLRVLPAVAIMPQNEICDASGSGLEYRALDLPNLEFTSAIVWHKTAGLVPQAAKVMELICSAHNLSNPLASSR